jgi:nitrogen fixation protein NifZ
MTDTETKPQAPMIEPRIPKFDWGQRVQASHDLVNDGSYPDREPEALLVRAGENGEIVQVGRHEESNTPVYLVEFSPGRVVGCLEEEIAPL